MEPGGSMPHSQGLSNNSYPEPNQPNYNNNNNNNNNNNTSITGRKHKKRKNPFLHLQRYNNSLSMESSLDSKLQWKVKALHGKYPIALDDENIHKLNPWSVYIYIYIYILATRPGFARVINIL